MTLALILNIALSAVVFAAIVTKIVWSIATQHHDRHDVLVADARRRRPQLYRRPRAVQARQAQSATARQGQAWPAS
jgi:hypothetical protein